MKYPTGTKKTRYVTDQNNPAVKEYKQAVEKGFPKNWVPTVYSEEQMKQSRLNESGQMKHKKINEIDRREKEKKVSEQFNDFCDEVLSRIEKRILEDIKDPHGDDFVFGENYGLEKALEIVRDELSIKQE